MGLWVAGSPVAALSASPATPPQAQQSACLHLRDAYSAVTFLQGDLQYSKLRTKNWSRTAWRTPSCIFRPTSTRQLRGALPLLVKSKTKFAIRSGGHSPSPQAANIDGGVLIDLSGFNRVAYNAASQVAVIGSGLTWGEVYAQLDPFGVTVVGGRVVLANGTTVNSSETHHKDLHWALKGGINNFGIVTSFTVSTYSIGKVWAGIKTYKLEQLPALYDAMLKYQLTPEKDPYANLMLQGFFSKETTGIMLSLVYLKPQEFPSAFAPFYHINATSDSMRMSNFSEFIAGQGPPSFPPRAYFRTAVFEPGQQLYNSLTSLMANSGALKRVKSMKNGTVAFGMQPISTGLVQAGRDRGGNALGLNLVNQTWFVINSGCEFAEDDELLRSATHDILGSIVKQSKTEQTHLPYLFMNDAGWDQNVLGSYGRDNVARLREVQAKYDESQVFQQLVPGGYKIPPLCK
ncbi:hypothetical protein MHUMG1_07667 [Metarhizium humberi]|uniref:FAD-binding PCMH-type domain-containing protein n=1 Tax=Metarhizium humberi TaxID=2596975 RepID=A0A9P8M6W3_9HYPO|nr:hypothetical protein MHUMG1_07667 [Metarhizium humberi]